MTTEMKRRQYLSNMNIREIRNKIEEEIEETGWYGDNGKKVKHILAMSIQEFTELYKKTIGENKNMIDRFWYFFHRCGAMRDGAVIIPEGYKGMIMYDAIMLRIEEVSRINFAIHNSIIQQ